MHDIDRIGFETQSEAGSFESGPFETGKFDAGSGETFSYEHTGEVFGEMEQIELASELLETESEAELDAVLRNLISCAGRAFGPLSSLEVKAIGGILKGVATRLLSQIGRDTGGAARDFGLELEGLSSEDREFEVARHYVDFAGEALRNLALASASDPKTAAVRAAVEAAKTRAPGLLRSQGDPEPDPYLGKLQRQGPGTPDNQCSRPRWRGRDWP